MPEEAPAQACYGLDIGAVSLVAARDDGELLRNECSDTSTKTVVSFSGKQRHLGEAAANSLSSNGRNTATAVGRLALMPHARLAASPLAAHWQFTHSERGGGGFEMEAQYNGVPRRFSGVQLLGALLAKVRATSGAGESPCVALVLPPCVEAGASLEDKDAALAFARAAVLDAAEIGGWKPVALPTAMEAAAVALSRKYPAAEAAVEGGEGSARHVMRPNMSKARPAQLRREWRRAGVSSARGCPGRHLGAASLGRSAAWAALSGQGPGLTSCAPLRPQGPSGRMRSRRSV